MTPQEWAAIAVAGTAVLMVLVVLFLFILARRLIATLQATAEEVRAEVVPLLQEGRAAVGKADSALAKSDELLGTATSVTETVDSASKLAYSVVSNPLIKTAALATGLGRGFKSLRGFR